MLQDKFEEKLLFEVRLNDELHETSQIDVQCFGKSSKFSCAIGKLYEISSDWYTHSMIRFYWRLDDGALPICQLAIKEADNKSILEIAAAHNKTTNRPGARIIRFGFFVSFFL